MRREAHTLFHICRKLSLQNKKEMMRISEIGDLMYENLRVNM